jgi:hypothetical protein
VELISGKGAIGTELTGNSNILAKSKSHAPTYLKTQTYSVAFTNLILQQQTPPSDLQLLWKQQFQQLQRLC